MPHIASQDVEVTGSRLVISATAHVLEEYMLRSLTGEPPELLKTAVFFVFWSFTFMVSVGVVGCFLNEWIAFTNPCPYYHPPC